MIGNLNKVKGILILTGVLICSFSIHGCGEMASSQVEKVEHISRTNEVFQPISISQDSEPEIKKELLAETYTVEYYPDVNSTLPIEIQKDFVSGEKTKIRTIEELGLKSEEQIFEGWRLYRESDGKWFLKDRQGDSSWRELVNGSLPVGYCFDFRGDGDILISPTDKGVVKLYAQWGGQSFTVQYHMDSNSEANETITEVNYGEETPSMALADLNMDETGAVFKGWRLFREIDNKWNVKSDNGRSQWINLKKGKLPESFRFSIFKEKFPLVKAATSGIVHAYAEWEGEFKVLYHKDMQSSASDLVSSVIYGKPAKSLTIAELGFDNGKVFKGWILHREIDDKWSLTDGRSSPQWKSLEEGSLPQGYGYFLYSEGFELVKAAPSGLVHAYAQWN